jgi:seryl-tRNA synthetase
MKIGNIVHPDVPVSLNEEDNLVRATYEGKGRKMKGESYHSLGEKFSITDLKRGQKVSGHRGYYLKHNGVKLALSLTHYAINFLTAKGYELHQTPAIIMKDIL